MPPSALTTTFIQSTFLNAIANVLAQIIDQYHRGKPLSKFHLNSPALLQFLIYGLLSVLPNFIWQRFLETQFPGFPTFARRRRYTTVTHPTPSRSRKTGKEKGKAGEVCITISLDDDDEHSDGDDLGLDGKVGGWGWFKEKNKSSSTKWRMGMGMGMGMFRPRKKEKANITNTTTTGWRNFLAKFLLDQTVGSVMNILLFVVLINLLKGVGWSGCWALVREDFRPIMMARLKYRPLVSVLMYTVVPVDRRVVFGSACGVIWGVYLSLYAVV
ncbi:uncharacterized protein BO97DRAFT_406514 [Aspergillus homomorphus CBS 101889]|uniref:Mpv17/PMP22 family protein n=1 Tax=Aspergillus homomorphus (strain CBS 101889) TaxID=1450537 RepID=A0A395HSU4_ASPHC|nr:hypothetical protein BO97DRAFT_406514 [Aspergillus homomorphus CBS 101889]RAL11011.1 hypothetical protein BO97DRAFT_406514 [Aspergillus homomorphus CBS 101889]